MSRYVDTRDVAKMMRPVLAREFPGVKFSVRIDRYSGGSSIRVHWTDGPTGKEVEEVARQFNGHGFDGMTDCSYSIDHTLNGETVHFGGSVSCTREYSERLWRLAMAHVARKFGVEVPADTLIKSSYGESWYLQDCPAVNKRLNDWCYSTIRDEVMHTLSTLRGDGWIVREVKARAIAGLNDAPEPPAATVVQFPGSVN